jgi:hypothetical protein
MRSYEQGNNRKTHQPLHGTDAPTQDAIEHYEERCPYKAKIYKRRLQTFLLRPAVASVLQGNNSCLILRREDMEQGRRQATVNSQEMANRLMEKCDKQASCNRKAVERQLRVQQ